MQIVENNVPGMTEPVELMVLNKLSQKINLKSDDIFVEFGPFFGRSTFSMLEGFIANTSRTTLNKVYAFDRFSCDINSMLTPHVYAHAQKAGIQNLLEQRDGKVIFEKIIRHYLHQYIEDEQLEICTQDLKDAQPPKGTIAFMHIDCPKKYLDFKTILYRFFPNIRPGSVIIFQDYFYHWSGSLIAVTQLLTESGIVKPSISAATSLVTEVIKRPTLEQLMEIDQAMSHEDIPEIIQRAIEMVGKLDVDRRDHFEPRLVLAKVQQLIVLKRNAEASSEIETYLTSGKPISASHIFNFSEMLKHSFEI